VEVKCKAAGGGYVNLSCKMLRPLHVGALFAAVERYQVAELDLGMNQLEAAGGALVAAALETNTTLTTLRCAQLGRPSNQGQGLAVSLEGPTLPALALLILASPFAQPPIQQARPQGWHGARRGPQEQHHPQDARVCCPAIEPTRPCLAAPQHARSLHWPSSRVPSPFAQPPPQRPRPRGWHGARRGPQEQHHPRDARVCCPAIEPTCPCVTVFPSPPRFRASHALPRSLEASQHPPRPRLTRDQPFPACVSDKSRTRTAHTQPAHTQSKLLACCRATATHAPAPRVDRGHALLCPRVGGERARTLPLATCSSQAAEQRPRRQSRAGPQSGRPPRPLPPLPPPPPLSGSLASPPAAASSCMYPKQAVSVRLYGVSYPRGCFRPSVISAYDTWF
jgi:hypothetical protein